MDESKLKVAHEKCNECLMSDGCLVSPRRRAHILRQCLSQQSYFVCHKASLKGQTVVCRGFYDRLGHTSQLIRIMERLQGILFVDVATLPKVETEEESET